MLHRALLNPPSLQKPLHLRAKSGASSQLPNPRDPLPVAPTKLPLTTSEIHILEATSVDRFASTAIRGEIEPARSQTHHPVLATHPPAAGTNRRSRPGPRGPRRAQAHSALAHRQPRGPRSPPRRGPQIRIQAWPRPRRSQTHARLARRPAAAPRTCRVRDAQARPIRSRRHPLSRGIWGSRQPIKFTTLIVWFDRNRSNQFTVFMVLFNYDRAWNRVIGLDAFAAGRKIR